MAELNFEIEKIRVTQPAPLGETLQSLDIDLMSDGVVLRTQCWSTTPDALHTLARQLTKMQSRPQHEAEG